MCKLLVLIRAFQLHTVPNVIDFPRYNMKCSGGNEILRGIIRAASRFPLHFMLYLGNLDYILDSAWSFSMTFKKPISPFYRRGNAQDSRPPCRDSRRIRRRGCGRRYIEIGRGGPDEGTRTAPSGQATADILKQGHCHSIKFKITLSFFKTVNNFK